MTSHADLVAVAERWLSSTRCCGVVLTEQGYGTERCDAIGWGKLGSIVVECKVSRDDVRRDRKKPHRTRDGGLGCERWLLTPQNLLRVDEVPDGWGLLEWTGHMVRRRVPAPIRDRAADAYVRELAVALGELRKYHVQGIRYRKLNRAGGYADDGALGSLAGVETT